MIGLKRFLWNDDKMIPRTIHYCRFDRGEMSPLAKGYHEAAKQELKKVDWSRQPEKTRKQCSKPLFALRLEFALRLLAFNCKRCLNNLKIS